MEKIYVAEYNPEQNQFHVELKNEKIKKVTGSFTRGNWRNECKWMTFFEGTVEECNKECSNLRKKLETSR